MPDTQTNRTRQWIPLGGEVTTRARRSQAVDVPGEEKSGGLPVSGSRRAGSRDRSQPRGCPRSTSTIFRLSLSSASPRLVRGLDRKFLDEPRVELEVGFVSRVRICKLQFPGDPLAHLNSGHPATAR